MNNLNWLSFVEVDTLVLEKYTFFLKKKFMLNRFFLPAFNPFWYFLKKYGQGFVTQSRIEPKNISFFYSFHYLTRQTRRDWFCGLICILQSMCLNNRATKCRIFTEFRFVFFKFYILVYNENADNHLHLLNFLDII